MVLKRAFQGMSGDQVRGSQMSMVRLPGAVDGSGKFLRSWFHLQALLPFKGFVGPGTM